MGGNELHQIPFELCAETLGAAVAAQRGGAGRVELCVELGIGGVTPPETLVREVLQVVRLPVNVLIRPRGGEFIYTDAEFRQIRSEIAWVKKAGAAGVALGVLLPDGRVDLARTRELVELARPMAVTFHRAIDETPGISEALEAVIATGADCVLTSGGAPDVLTGADQLAALVRQAAGRIEIMAGGGLKLDTLPELVARTGVDWVHGSLTRREPTNTPSRNPECVAQTGGELSEDSLANLETDVRQVVGLLQATARAF